MSSVNNSVSKSVFPAVHHPLRVPSALVGSGGGPGPLPANTLLFNDQPLTYESQVLTYAG